VLAQAFREAFGGSLSSIKEDHQETVSDSLPVFLTMHCPSRIRLGFLI
jgi:hypothetical protein